MTRTPDAARALRFDDDLPARADRRAGGGDAALREPYTSVWICPFCGEDVASAPQLSNDHDRTERELRAHLRERHPIRRRLSRKYRTAFKISEASVAD